ncbi:putative TonB-dependent receptor [Neisseria gonorrhoeae]|uniref:Putative TonB-dependent receptor n=1 Tax=Neisseria gonorrhoeae TaxID=485 RepID=A0A378W0D9_NEIGO|nr:putative TonB-dependent receptor [Neisseria gonorrhoeae]
MSRFPSVYEVGSFYNDVAYAGMPKAPNFRFKPERSRSWEIGYSFNLPRIGAGCVPAICA